MKILFYDVKDFELNYLLERTIYKTEPYYFKISLNESCYVDEKHLDSEAISCFVNSQLTREALSKFKNLKYIFLRCVGYSNVDLKYCKEKNIKVFNTPNYGNSTVAEYTFALLLALSKKILQAKKSLNDGEINQSLLTGIELQGKTIGIIGAGAIGRKVISIAYGFGMNVLVYDVNPKGAYDFVELDDLLMKSDFISINCPLNESTKGLINQKAISKMKRNAIIINTARGEIIDTMALYWAIAKKQIQGAALDVVECEEVLCQSYGKCLKNDNLKANCLKKFFFIQKLMQLSNVIITPHNAYNTHEAQVRILDITLENIKESFNITSSTNNLVLI